MPWKPKTNAFVHPGTHTQLEKVQLGARSTVQFTTVTAVSGESAFDAVVNGVWNAYTDGYISRELIWEMK